MKHLKTYEEELKKCYILKINEELVIVTKKESPVVNGIFIHIHYIYDGNKITSFDITKPNRYTEKRFNEMLVEGPIYLETALEKLPILFNSNKYNL